MTAELVSLDGFDVTGISVKTCNADEMTSEMAGQLDGKTNASSEVAVVGSGRSANEPQETGDDHNPKLGFLWARFYEDYLPCLPDNPSMYGVYYEYESDENGSYRVLAGSSSKPTHNKNIIKETVSVPAGQYLKFRATGGLPEAAVQAWQQVWAYFSQQDCPHERLFDVDVEKYVSLSEVEVLIGVK